MGRILKDRKKDVLAVSNRAESEPFAPIVARPLFIFTVVHLKF